MGLEYRGPCPCDCHLPQQGMQVSHFVPCCGMSSIQFDGYGSIPYSLPEGATRLDLVFIGGGGGGANPRVSDTPIFDELVEELGSPL